MCADRKYSQRKKSTRKPQKVTVLSVVNNDATETQRALFAKAYVAMAEVDYDLRRWGEELQEAKSRGASPTRS